MQRAEEVDKELLAQFLTEGVHQRGMIMERMLTSFYEKRMPRHLIEVEFYRNYIMSLDDLIKWYHVLKEWQPDWKPLHIILQDVLARKRSNVALFAAYTLEEVSRIDKERLYERLNLPGDRRQDIWLKDERGRNCLHEPWRHHHDLAERRNVRDNVVILLVPR